MRKNNEVQALKGGVGRSFHPDEILGSTSSIVNFY